MRSTMNVHVHRISTRLPTSVRQALHRLYGLCCRCKATSKSYTWIIRHGDSPDVIVSTGEFFVVLISTTATSEVQACGCRETTEEKKIHRWINKVPLGSLHDSDHWPLKAFIKRGATPVRHLWGKTVWREYKNVHILQDLGMAGCWVVPIHQNPFYEEQTKTVIYCG